MRRELSSTFFWVYRWLIPGLLTLAAVAVLWVFALSETGSGDVFPALILSALLMILARLYDRAKRVWLEEDHLIVGWYKQETPIPLGNILEVNRTPGLWPPRICIRLSKPAPFGERLCFFPPLGADLEQLQGLAGKPRD